MRDTVLILQIEEDCWKGIARLPPLRDQEIRMLAIQVRGGAGLAPYLRGLSDADDAKLGQLELAFESRGQLLVEPLRPFERE